MTYLESQIFETLETLGQTTRGLYLNALQKSLKVDLNCTNGTFPDISTPQDIAKFGLTMEDQYKLRVSLLKPLALQFLIQEVQVPERGLAGKLNWRNYEKRFGQPPIFYHQKPLIMLLTYAEWLHLVLDQPSQLELEILKHQP
jgi:hypothetical protein